MSVTVIVTALLVAAVTGWPLVALVLRWSEGTRPRRQAPDRSPTDVGSAADAAEADPDVHRSAQELLRGGLWIGLLERVAVTGAVLLGEYTIVAAVVAVKGLGRFKELSTPEASERFVVGTLASLTWAGLVGAAARGVLTLLA